MVDLDPQIIDRAIVLVIPKEPYYDWDKEVFPDTEGISELKEFNSYLIEESISADNPKKSLKKYWEYIFENELFNICTDEEAWPKNRTWNLFNEWFELKFSTVVTDLLNYPISKEEF